MEKTYEGFIQNIKNAFKPLPETKNEPITKQELVDVCTDAIIDLTDNQLSINYNLTHEKLKFDHAGNYYPDAQKNVNFSIEIVNTMDNFNAFEIEKSISNGFNTDSVKSEILFLIELLTSQYLIIDIHIQYKYNVSPDEVFNAKRCSIDIQEFENMEDTNISQLLVIFKSITRR